MGLPEPDLKKIKIVDLSPNDYNPQEMAKDKYKGLVNHIRSVGFTDPLKIRVTNKELGDPQDTPYVLVDGEHRLRAFMEVFPDEKEILCAMMKGPSGEGLTRKEAIVSTVAYNFQHGEENAIKMGQALRLALEDGMLIEDIEDLTGMKRNRIESYMSFEELPELENPEIPPFSDAGDPEKFPKMKDPIIISFAIYPEDRDVIDRALTKMKAFLPPEVDIDEERGKCLLLMAQDVLGIMGAHEPPPEEETPKEDAGVSESAQVGLEPAE